MKLTVLQEDLAKSLSTASRFVNTRAQLPVLSNIHLRTSKNKLIISSTNLEMSFSTSIGAQVDEEGEIALPAKTVSDLVGSLAKGQLSLTLDRESVTFENASTNAKVSGVNPAEFPVVPTGVEEGALDIKYSDFSDMISHVVFASSSDETRPVLTGILLLMEAKTMTMVATDGFRLSRKTIKAEGKGSEKIILPKNSLNEVLRIGGQTEKIQMALSKDDNNVVFGIGPSVISTRVIDGSFPNYEKIIPESSKISINVGKDELLSAIKSASVFARDSSNFVTFSIGDALELSSKSAQSGKQKTSVDAKISGANKEAIEISFNYKFVEDFLQSVKGESVDIKLNDGASSGVFLDSEDGDYLHLIMPVKG